MKEDKKLNKIKYNTIQLYFNPSDSMDTELFEWLKEKKEISTSTSSYIKKIMYDDMKLKKINNPNATSSISEIRSIKSSDDLDI